MILSRKNIHLTHPKAQKEQSDISLNPQKNNYMSTIKSITVKEFNLMLQRRYLMRLQRCVEAFEALENRPKMVIDFFEALLLQANLDYQHLLSIYLKEKSNEKKEKKNAL